MSDDSIYHEVSEELREQELAQFWKENRYWIAGGVAAAIVFTGTLSWWRDHERATNIKATTEMTAALDTRDPEKIAAHADEAGKNHSLLSRFAEARTYLDRGEKDKAAAAFRAIAATKRIDKDWKDLARLYAVNAALDTDAETGSLHEDLSPLVNDDKNPWHYSARELDALIYAKEGKTDKAEDIFSGLADDIKAPPGLRNRAATLRTLYAGDGNGDKKDAGKENGEG